MPQTTLSQSQIDALIAAAGRKVEEYDYRGGKAFDNNAVADLEGLHKAFARDLSQRFSQLLQVPVLVEANGTDQARYDSYVHSLPSPTIVGVVALSPGGAMVVTDLANHLGFAMIDILLGGSGRPMAYRAFTELEGDLLTEIAGHISSSIGTAFEPVVNLDPQMAAIQSMPAVGHVAVSTEPSIILSFRVRLESHEPTEGILSICYPRHSLDSILSDKQVADDDTDLDIANAPLALPLANASLDLSVRLTGSKLTLLELSQLQPGDVVVLGHQSGEPATVSIHGVNLFAGDIGRHNGRMALRLTNWMAK